MSPDPRSQTKLSEEILSLQGAELLNKLCVTQAQHLFANILNVRDVISFQNIIYIFRNDNRSDTKLQITYFSLGNSQSGS